MISTVALIPAAGKSIRMGRPKLLLPLGDATVLARLLGAVRRAGIERILVVASPGNGLLVDEAVRHGATVLTLTAETPDMRATAIAGLDWIETHWPDLDGFFLIPADHPTLGSAVFANLLDAADARANATIIVPTFEGRRGHPTWISRLHIEGLRKLGEGKGINEYLREQAERTREVPCIDPAVLVDLDTPSDYDALIRSPLA